MWFRNKGVFCARNKVSCYGIILFYLFSCTQLIFFYSCFQISLLHVKIFKNPFLQNDQSSDFHYSKMSYQMNTVRTPQFKNYIQKWKEFKVPWYQNEQSSEFLYSKMTRVPTFFFPKWQSSNFLYSKMNRIYYFFIPKWIRVVSYSGDGGGPIFSIEKDCRTGILHGIAR